MPERLPLATRIAQAVDAVRSIFGVKDPTLIGRTARLLGEVDIGDANVGEVLDAALRSAHGSSKAVADGKASPAAAAEFLREALEDAVEAIGKKGRKRVAHVEPPLTRAEVQVMIQKALEGHKAPSAPAPAPAPTREAVAHEPPAHAHKAPAPPVPTEPPAAPKPPRPAPEVSSLPPEPEDTDERERPTRRVAPKDQNAPIVVEPLKGSGTGRTRQPK